MSFLTRRERGYHSNPLVSVIIPAFNTAEYLPAAIESVLEQTYSNIQLIVINDGSTDKTDEVVQPYLSRVKYIKQENRGLSATRNVGVKHSVGEFVCFLDADDILLKEKTSRQLKLFEERPELDVVICGWYFIDTEGNRIGKPSVIAREYGLIQLLRWQVFPPHAALIRRGAFASTDGFDETIPVHESQEDWHLWLRMALDGKRFASIEEQLVGYRKREGSISSDFEKHVRGAKRVIELLQRSDNPAVTQEHISRLNQMIHVRIAAAYLSKGDPKRVADALRDGWKEVGSRMANSDTWNFLLSSHLRSESLDSDLAGVFHALPYEIRNRFEAGYHIALAENMQWSGSSLRSVPLLFRAVSLDPSIMATARGLKSILRPLLPRKLILQFNS